MNVVKEIENINLEELRHGVEVGKGSWHDDHLNEPYVFCGGIDKELSEGDVICVFSEFGTVVDIHFPRDKDDGKALGFAFIGYQDPRSCVLAVDNMNSVKLCDSVLRVDHKPNFTPPKEYLPNSSSSSSTSRPDTTSTSTSTSSTDTSRAGHTTQERRSYSSRSGGESFGKMSLQRDPIRRVENESRNDRHYSRNNRESESRRSHDHRDHRRRDDRRGGGDRDHHGHHRHHHSHHERDLESRDKDVERKQR